MLKFRELRADDFNAACPIMYKESFGTSESSFVALYVWSKLFNCEICFDDGTVFFRSVSPERRSYLFPYGGDIKKSLEKIYDEEISQGAPCVFFHSITDEMRERLEAVFPGEFEYTEKRASFDYVYTAESLATLSGKMLHQKRNHINKFIKRYEGRYMYEPMTTAHIEDVLAFQKKWINMISDKDGKSTLLYESEAIETLLQRFSEFNLYGGVLFVDGEVCAYCLASQISDDTMDVMVEKADYSFNGAYQMINKCFAESARDKVRYLNREDDMGIEGLRKSKLSYCPEKLVRKYSVIWKR